MIRGGKRKERVNQQTQRRNPEGPPLDTLQNALHQEDSTRTGYGTSLDG